MADRVLVIGRGGREHALAWKLAQSVHLKQILIAPGNAGTANDGKMSNSGVLISNHTILSQFCKDHNIGCVIAGPETLLAAAVLSEPFSISLLGIVDDLVAAGIQCFGPTAKAAQLGTNRYFTNIFLDQHGIPTARWKAFSNPKEACAFINSLACMHNNADYHLMPDVNQHDNMCCHSGDSSETVIIEELLKGEEFSVSEVLLEKIKSTLLQHILESMKQEGMLYAGVLQVELMLTKSGVKVLSVGCHFGDPQCQIILQLLKSDLYEVIQAAVGGQLCNSILAWSDNCTAVSVSMENGSYLQGHKKSMEITGLLQANELGLEIFHGATIIKEGKVLSNGNRILTVTAVKQDIMSPSHEDRISDSIACSILDHSSVLSPERSTKLGCPGHDGFISAFFDLKASGYRDPILVSHAKGVGTKLKIAQLCNKHDMIGQDLVAICVNDLLVQGAEPLFFHGHFAFGKLDVGVAQLTQVISDGIVEACKLAGCTFLGRETNEMPATCAAGEYNLVGFAVGAVERSMKFPQQGNIVNEDIVIGIASSGLHHQGFDLREAAQKVLKDVQKHEDTWLIGKVVHRTAGYPQVEIKNLSEVLLKNKWPFLKDVSNADNPPHTIHRKHKVKIAVLISGTGTSLSALLAYAKEPASCSEVVLVIANRSGVEELRNATLAGIPTRVIDHKLYGSRSEYEGTIDSVLEEFSIELICLSGFIRILSSNFLRKWYGKMLGTYPSVSPLRRNIYNQAHPSTDKIVGCTVHFVLEETSPEAIIVQEPVCVKAEDTQETLYTKIKEAENHVFPMALQLVASGMVQLRGDGKIYWERERQELICQKARQDC
ncbi:Bifunctional purine biosynthetic protein purD [Ophiophagus hannah]|uniref:Bifunctional purine biosynthetic protein purD n=1 Tax=Ophiophagus hannah TaxID=8665 RepID=V8PFP6_OPHHA|nr:Bifunctional purine biosynthetic protein purD [Ophiophagus hannah]